MNKIKAYEETHQRGIMTIEKEITDKALMCDFGIRVSEDGRIWICIDGQAFIRFKPIISDTPAKRYDELETKFKSMNWKKYKLSELEKINDFINGFIDKRR